MKALSPAAVVLLLAVVLTVVLTGCPASTRTAPVVDAADAARYSAELTAAQVDHRQTLEDAEVLRKAGKLTGAPLERMRTAGRELDSAMLRFKAELDLYRAGGGESDAFNRARAAMAQARTNLALTWEAVKRGR